MNEEKKSTGTKKSSRATAQKSPGEKLKNEQSAREAVRKKLRYGKKDNSLTVEEKKQLMGLIGLRSPVSLPIHPHPPF